MVADLPVVAYIIVDRRDADRYPIPTGHPPQFTVALARLAMARSALEKLIGALRHLHQGDAGQQRGYSPSILIENGFKCCD